MKITCQSCGITFEAGEVDAGKWLVCQRCEAAVRAEPSAGAIELGLPPTTSEPVQGIELQGTARQESPGQQSQPDPPVHIEPKPSARRTGSSTYEPRKRKTDIAVICSLVFAFALASTVCEILFELARLQRKPRPPAPLVNKEQIEEMERSLEMRSYERIATAIEKYEAARKSGSAKEAWRQACFVACEYQRLEDEENHQKWKAKAEAEWPIESAK